MLSYKEYKLINESLYGAFNLGLKAHSTVGGIVSGSPINGTEAAEEALEEAKKMKKKMDGEIESEKEGDDDEEEVVKKVDSGDEDSDDDEDSEEDDSDDEGDDEEDSDDDEEDSEEKEPESEKKDFAFMKKKMKNKMKKKSKKEWSDFMSDLESILEGIDDEDSLTEVKKGLEMMKKGMENGMKKKMDGGCGKKCGKYMNEADQDWWNSVNSMINASPDQKAWDGWSEVGEVQQAVREGEQIDEGILQDLGKSKFVRNAVTAAGLGAAALGGYAAKGMGSKVGADASGGRSVATARQEDLGVNQELANKLIEPGPYSGGFEYMTFADRSRVLDGEQVKATPEFIRAWEQKTGKKAPSVNAFRGMEGGQHTLSWR